MVERKLKLVKSGKKRAKQIPEEATKQPQLTNHQLSITNYQLPISNPQSPNLTPAEQAEAERFKALTRERAARQAKVRRIIRKLREWDVLSRVA